MLYENLAAARPYINFALGFSLIIVKLIHIGVQGLVTIQECIMTYEYSAVLIMAGPIGFELL